MSASRFSVDVRGLGEAETFTKDQVKLLRKTLEAATNVAMQLGVERLAKLTDELVPEHMQASTARWAQRRRGGILDRPARGAWRWRYIDSARRFHRRRKARAAADASAIWGRFGVRGKPLSYETGTAYQYWVRAHKRRLRDGRTIEVPGSKATLPPLTKRRGHVERRRARAQRPYMRRVDGAGAIWSQMLQGHDDVTLRLVEAARDIAVREGRIPRRSELRKALASMVFPAGGVE